MDPFFRMDHITPPTMDIDHDVEHGIWDKGYGIQEWSIRQVFEILIDPLDDRFGKYIFIIGFLVPNVKIMCNSY